MLGFEDFSMMVGKNKSVWRWGHTDFVIYWDLVPCGGYFTSTFEADVVPSV